MAAHHDYQCETCKGIWDMTSPPPMTHCPDCRTPLTKLPSAPAFKLRGGGWHDDEYNAYGPK